MNPHASQIGPSTSQRLGMKMGAQQALDDVTPAIQDNLDQEWETWEEQG
jgi:hypothetical protein